MSTMVCALLTLACLQSPLALTPFDIKMPSGSVVKAERGTLEVPEVRGRQGARKLKLAVVKLRCVGQASRPPVFYLDGGPGGSAIGAAQSSPVGDVLERLLAKHDVVLMDQRGTGQSTPSTVWPADEPLPDDVFLSKEKATEVFERWQKKAAEFQKGKGMDFRGYNSVESADDLVQLAAALGAPKICLLGFSYGTHLALATIKRHPKRIECAVLVGTEGPNDTLKLPSIFDAQFAKLSALAAQDPALRGQVPDLTELTRRVLDRLDKEPVTVRFVANGAEHAMPIGRFGLQLLLRFDIGDGNDFPDFPRLMLALDRGDPKHLTKYVAKRYSQVRRGLSAMSILMDLASGATALRRRQIELETEGSILGSAVNFGDSPSPDIWGDVDLGDAYRAPFSSTVRALFVSGTLDSNCPPFQAERVRWGFSDARHLIAQYAGHEDMLPNGKVQDQILRFLGGLEPETFLVDLGKPKFLPIE